MLFKYGNDDHRRKISLLDRDSYWNIYKREKRKDLITDVHLNTKLKESYGGDKTGLAKWWYLFKTGDECMGLFHSLMDSFDIWIFQIKRTTFTILRHILLLFLAFIVNWGKLVILSVSCLQDFLKYSSGIEE